jgi:1,4-alpha-glucan branching enzyme
MGLYEELLNSDKDIYGGSNVFNGLPLQAKKEPMHQREFSITLKVAPLSITILEYRSGEGLFESEVIN